jgi:PAS domain S-box-containing protein
MTQDSADPKVQHPEIVWPNVSAPNRSAHVPGTIPSLKERFGDWYQNAPMGFHSIDAGGTIIDINDTELDWLGYSRDEITGKMHVSTLLTEKSKQILLNAAARPSTYGGSGYLEYEAIRKDGSILHLLSYDLPFKNAQGEVIAYFISNIDISARKFSEEKLQISEANFSRAQGLAHVGHYEFDFGDKKFPSRAYWSDELFRIFGRNPQDGALSLKDTIEQCIHPDDRSASQRYVDETFTGTADLERELRIVRPDGSVRHINGIARFSPGLGHRADKLFGVIRDITDLKLAQENLDRSERRFRAMIEKTDETIALFSREGLVLYASPSVSTLMGLPPEQLTGRHVWELVHPDDVPAVANDLTAVISVPGSTAVSQFRTPHPSGEWRWVESAATNRLDDPNVGAIIVNVRDISGRKRMDQALTETNIRLRELSANLEEVREKERAEIAQALHDEVGQHYAALQMGIHWLEQRHSNDPESVEKTKQMRQMMARAFGTIRNIIQSLHPPMLDDLGLIGALEALVEDVTQASGITIEFSGDAQCEALPKTHQLALFRSLQEALTNVSRHAKASNVKVNLQCNALTASLQVDDNGAGMAATAREKRGSFGLFGMSERAKALGGSFEVKSELGTGTTIRLSLPLHDRRQGERN